MFFTRLLASLCLYLKSFATHTPPNDNPSPSVPPPKPGRLHMLRLTCTHHIKSLIQPQPLLTPDELVLPDNNYFDNGSYSPPPPEPRKPRRTWSQRHPRDPAPPLRPLPGIQELHLPPPVSILSHTPYDDEPSSVNNALWAPASSSRHNRWSAGSLNSTFSLDFEVLIPCRAILRDISVDTQLSTVLRQHAYYEQRLVRDADDSAV